MNASLKPVQTSADADRSARVDLAACYRLKGRLRLNEGIDNHLTLLVPGYSDRFLLAPFGMHWSEVKASDFLVVDFSGRVVSGHGAVYSSAGASAVAAGPLRIAHPHAICDRAMHAGESAPGDGRAERARVLRRRGVRSDVQRPGLRYVRGGAPGASARRQIGAHDGQSRRAGGR